MEPLDNREMSAVTGQEGIAVELELRANADTHGQPLNPACATDLAQTDCRLALQFTGRETEWVVIKGFYGTVKIPEMHIDSAITPVTSTEHEDLTRFQDEDGTPMLASPHGLPSLQLSFPEDIEIWNLTVSGASIEYDDGSTPGFERNELGSFLGVKISNSIPNQPARITAEGRALIYGF